MKIAIKIGVFTVRHRPCAPYPLRLVWAGDEAHLTAADSVLISLVSIGGSADRSSDVCGSLCATPTRSSATFVGFAKRTSRHQEKTSQLEVTLKHIDQLYALAPVSKDPLAS